VEQALRVLVNVAYNQPVTAQAVIASRGVDGICGTLAASDLMRVFCRDRMTEQMP
jgi:chromosome segregation and condensation protein ScpB